MADADQPERHLEPVDRLGRLAAAMSDALEAHPEYGKEKAIVMLSSDAEQRRMAHLHNYDADIDALADMLMHLRAIFRANGKSFELEFLKIPDDLSGLAGPDH